MQPRPSGGPDNGLSDESLLAGLASGDDDAGAAFTRRFEGRVFGMAVTMLNDAALAQDVAQEAFVRAWLHAATFDPRRGTVSAWLLRITRNLAIDTMRVRRPQPMDPDLLAVLDVASTAPAVEELVMLADTTSAVGAALKKLPAEQARALVMAAFYGQTAQEISLAEKIPLGTAKTRIRLGLRKIRAMLLDQAALLEVTPQ